MSQKLKIPLDSSGLVGRLIKKLDYVYLKANNEEIKLIVEYQKQYYIKVSSLKLKFNFIRKIGKTSKILFSVKISNLEIFRG